MQSGDNKDTLESFKDTELPLFNKVQRKFEHIFCSMVLKVNETNKFLTF